MRNVTYKSVTSGLFFLEAVSSTLLDNYAFALMDLPYEWLPSVSWSVIHLTSDAQVDFFKSLAVSNSTAVSILAHFSLLTSPLQKVLTIMYFPCFSLAVPGLTLTCLVTQKGTDFPLVCSLLDS